MNISCFCTGAFPASQTTLLVGSLTGLSTFAGSSLSSLVNSSAGFLKVSLANCLLKLALGVATGLVTVFRGNRQWGQTSSSLNRELGESPLAFLRSALRHQTL